MAQKSPKQKLILKWFQICSSPTSWQRNIFLKSQSQKIFADKAPILVVNHQAWQKQLQTSKRLPNLEHKVFIIHLNKPALRKHYIGTKDS